jgi:hypothetical protein
LSVITTSPILAERTTLRTELVHRYSSRPIQLIHHPQIHLLHNPRLIHNNTTHRCSSSTQLIIMTTPAPATTPPRERTGACLCGRIKYRLVGESVYDTFCHCIPCRKWTGSVALTASICPKEVCTLTMEGYYCTVEKKPQRRKEETQPNPTTTCTLPNHSGKK